MKAGSHRGHGQEAAIASTKRPPQRSQPAGRHGSHGRQAVTAATSKSPCRPRPGCCHAFSRQLAMTSNQQVAMSWPGSKLSRPPWPASHHGRSQQATMTDTGWQAVTTASAGKHPRRPWPACDHSCNQEAAADPVRKSPRAQPGSCSMTKTSNPSRVSYHDGINHEAATMKLPPRCGQEVAMSGSAG